MCRLLLLSHSELSKSFYNTMELIMGQAGEEVSYIILPYGQDLDEYQKKIEKEVEKAKNSGILILTDLFGGSPFIMTTRVYDKYHEKIPMEIICGMNLAMVMETISVMSKNLKLSELKNIAIEAGRNGIVDFKEKLNNSTMKGETEHEY